MEKFKAKLASLSDSMLVDVFLKATAMVSDEADLIIEVASQIIMDRFDEAKAAEIFNQAYDLI